MPPLNQGIALIPGTKPVPVNFPASHGGQVPIGGRISIHFSSRVYSGIGNGPPRLSLPILDPEEANCRWANLIAVGEMCALARLYFRYQLIPKISELTVPCPLRRPYVSICGRGCEIESAAACRANALQFEPVLPAAGRRRFQTPLLPDADRMFWHTDSAGHGPAQARGRQLPKPGPGPQSSPSPSAQPAHLAANCGTEYFWR